ncbi:MAG: hypothetical protein AB8F94_03690 [Saprospiraceae bacterium]
MKKIFWLVLPLVFLFSNCKKDDDILFEMDYFYDFTITAGLSPFSGTHFFEITDIPSLSDVLFSQSGKTAEELNAINPGRAVLRGIFANPDNSYIQEVSVKIFSKEDPTVEREIFYRDQIALNASGDLGLIGTLIDAKSYLEKDDFGIRIAMRLRDISPETIEMRLDFSFFAK